MSKQDRQGVRTAQDLERKYKFGEQEKLIKEMRKAIDEAKKSIADMKEDMKPNKNSVMKSDIFTTTISIFLEPGEEEITTIANHVAGIQTIPTNKRSLYDFNDSGDVTAIDERMARRAQEGLLSLANWDGAVKSTVTISIDVTNPEKLIGIKGTNMWGREVELSATELIELILKDIESNKVKIENLNVKIDALDEELELLKNGNESSVYTTTINIFLEPGEEEITTIANHVAGIQTIPTNKRSLYDFNDSGDVTAIDERMARQAQAGLMSLAGWSGAIKSNVTVTIDMSTPEKIISIKGTNMWGREVELTASELIADMLLDVDFLKTDVSSLKADVSDLEDDVSNLEERVDALESGSGSGGTVDIIELENNISELQRDVSSLDNDVYNLQYDVSDLEDDVSNLEERVNALESSSGSGGASSNDKDYIVEQGTSEIWTYEKWNSGKVVCWCKMEKESVQYYDSGILDACYHNYFLAFPSGLFSSVPSYISITALTSSQSWVINSVVRVSETSIGWSALRFGIDGAGDYDVGFYIEVRS